MLGFIGTGTITAAMVEGLGGGAVVSPRGAEVAARLARLPGVTVAASNQAVVDSCETVVLAIRPQVAAEVVPPLRFRPGQRIISLIAATSLDTLAAWAPGTVICRAVPLPFVERREGVTPVFPPDPEALTLFDRLGQAIPCQSQRDFDLLAVCSAVMGTHFGLLQTIQTWAEAEGLAPEAARAYLGGLSASLGRVAAESPSPFATLREEYSTKGGLNEQMFRVFAEAGGAEALTEALASVLSRVVGAAKTV